MCQFKCILYRIFTMMPFYAQKIKHLNIYKVFLHNILIYKHFIAFLNFFWIIFKPTKIFGKVIAISILEQILV